MLPPVVAGLIDGVPAGQMREMRLERVIPMVFALLLRRNRRVPYGIAVVLMMLLAAMATAVVSNVGFGKDAGQSPTEGDGVPPPSMPDPYAVVASAVGTLAGPLHGGANEDVIKMLEEIRMPEYASAYIEKAIAQKKLRIIVKFHPT